MPELNSQLETSKHRFAEIGMRMVEVLVFIYRIIYLVSEERT